MRVIIPLGGCVPVSLVGGFKGLVGVDWRARGVVQRARGVAQGLAGWLKGLVGWLRGGVCYCWSEPLEWSTMAWRVCRPASISRL